MKPTAIPFSFLKNPIHLLALGFGSGLLPKGPGTWGTVAAIPLYLILIQMPFWAYALSVFLGLLLGIYVCDVAAKHLGVHDHPSIVWDEIIGFWITMMGMPHTGLAITMGFILFRLFDIWKPWPIRWLDQRVQGGLGIMLDDVLAAIFAWVVLWVLVHHL